MTTKTYRVHITENTNFGWVVLYNDTFEGTTLHTPFSPMPVDSKPPFYLMLCKMFPTLQWKFNNGQDVYNTKYCAYIANKEGSLFVATLIEE